MRRLLPIFGTRGAVGGEGGALVFETLQDVVNAINSEDLVDGQSWTITWTGDDYIPNGTVYGTVWQGKPYWRGLLPSNLLGTTLTATSGAFTLDADGRPVLSATGDGTTVDNIDLGFLIGAFSQIKMSGVYTSGVPSVTGNEAASVFVGKQGSELSNNVTAGLTYLSLWQVYAQGLGNPFAPLIPSPDFSTGLPFTVGINVWRHPTESSPRATAIGQHSANALQLFDSGTAIAVGMGDWKDSLDLVLRVRLRDLGVAATFVFTGLEVIL